MALLVCFHEAGSEIDWSKKAIYLEQSFYELLFYYYRKHESDSPLKAMVSIGYEDEFIITEGRIDETLCDLKRLVEVEGVEHPQIPLMCSVLREASSRTCGLVVAGDMYPDLSRK
jgi:hypothetical protein